jgi:hypothetical protein
MQGFQMKESLGEMTQLAFLSSVGCLERGRWAGEQNKKDVKNIRAKPECV